MIVAAPVQPSVVSAETAQRLRHRAVGAAMLVGDGLEIGALHYPLAVPETARVAYLDVEDAPTLRTRFPELDAHTLVEPQWIGDIVQASVAAICGRRFDFVIMNHVLEHVANPIQALLNVWDGLAEGGLLLLSVPDRAFTYDHGRALTSYEHLLSEFYGGATAVDPAHYVDLLERVRPEVFANRARFLAALEDATTRREHAHVWDSESFRQFWVRAVSLLRLTAHGVYESAGAANSFEYFAVVRRGAPSRGATSEGTALSVLSALYCARGDLQREFSAAAPELARQLLTWATTAGAEVDSDATALRPFQACYRRLLFGATQDPGRIETRFRSMLTLL